MITGEILRGRFRDGFATPQPVAPDAIVRYTIDLHSRAHVFRAGHRIMVQVQSSWFPLYDRNPQRYVESIFLAKDADYVKATQRVHRSRASASSVVLPVINAP
jgi:predicted acyl esterase